MWEESFHFSGEELCGFEGRECVLGEPRPEPQVHGGVLPDHPSQEEIQPFVGVVQGLGDEGAALLREEGGEEEGEAAGFPGGVGLFPVMSEGFAQGSVGLQEGLQGKTIPS